MSNLPGKELTSGLQASVFARLAAITPQGIFIAGADERVVWLNAQAGVMAGAASGQIIGQPWLQMVCAEDRPRAENSWREAVESGRAFCQELRCHDQSRRAMFRVAAFGSGDLPGGVVGVMEDVTEARQSDEHRRQFFDKAVDLIGVVDLKEMRLERVNPAFERVLGYTAEEFLTRTDAGIHPEDMPAASENGEALRRGLPVASVVRHRSRSGEYRCISWSTYPVLEIGKAYAIGRDITEAWQAGKQGRRLTALVEHASDMIETAALDGTVTYVNPAGLAMLGWEAVPPQSTLGDFFPPGRREQSLAAVRAKQMHGEGWESEIELYNRGNGEVIPVHAKAFAIRGADGQPVARAFIARDMRQWRQAEAALRQAEKLAAMGRVAATVAHEINNPLAAAVNLAYLLASGAALDKNSRRLARGLEKELARVTAITRQTLGYHQHEPGLARVRLAELLSGVLGAFSARITMRHITVEKHLDTRMTVTGSLNELRQVLINLVGNALDAMGEGGTLSICLACGEGWEDCQERGALITIADTGPGIGEADLKHIFDPFFTTKSGGTGLGLWVSQGIIRQHQGTIRCLTPAGGGCCFEVFLPATRHD